MSDAPAAAVLLGDRLRASLRCPVHNDRRASLSAKVTDDGIVLVHCFAGCATGDIVDAFGLTIADLFPPGRLRRARPPRRRLSELPVPEDTSTPIPGDYWLSRLATKRGWNLAVLKRLGCYAVRDRFGVVRVRFPFTRNGRVVYWQDRRVADGEPRWMGPSGTVPCPFQAGGISLAHERRHAYLVEGVSDVVALLHAFPKAIAFGIPGNTASKAEWAAAFSSLTVWVLADADAAGQRLRRTVANHLAGRAEVRQIIVPPPWMDVDEWRRGAGEEFREQLMTSVLAAAERS